MPKLTRGQRRHAARTTTAHIHRTYRRGICGDCDGAASVVTTTGTAVCGTCHGGGQTWAV